MARQFKLEVIKKTLSSTNAERLDSPSNNRLVFDALIQAEESNVGSIRLGGSNITSSLGIKLKPEAVITLGDIFTGESSEAFIKLSELWAIGQSGDSLQILFPVELL